MSKPVLILCALGNDAVLNDAEDEYIDIGPNMRHRLQTALKWRSTVPSDREVRWLFGAGTNLPKGPTLACLAVEYLNTRTSDNVWFNSSGWNYYGTLEEMEWIAAEVQRYLTDQVLEFVFFNQPRTLWRTRLIWLLFHPRWYLRTTFVAVDQVNDEVATLRHECGGIVKVIGVRSGLIKPRHKNLK